MPTRNVCNFYTFRAESQGALFIGIGRPSLKKQTEFNSLLGIKVDFDTDNIASYMNTRIFYGRGNFH